VFGRNSRAQGGLRDRASMVSGENPGPKAAGAQKSNSRSAVRTERISQHDSSNLRSVLQNREFGSFALRIFGTTDLKPLRSDPAANSEPDRFLEFRDRWNGSPLPGAQVLNDRSGNRMRGPGFKSKKCSGEFLRDGPDDDRWRAGSQSARFVQKDIPN